MTHTRQHLGSLLSNRRGGKPMGNDFYPLVAPVTVAQNGVALTILIDQPDHGYRRNLSNRLMQPRCQLITVAAVDNHHTGSRHDDTQIIVMSAIFIGGRAGVASGDIDARRNLSQRQRCHRIAQRTARWSAQQPTGQQEESRGFLEDPKITWHLHDIQNIYPIVIGNRCNRPNLHISIP